MRNRLAARALALLAGLTALVLVPLQAADKDLVGFRHKDWGLQCDNTRACRAVGYQADAGDSEPVSIRLTREAGPGTPVLVDLQVSTEQATPAALNLQVGKLSLPGLTGDIPRIPAGQVAALLQALQKNEEAIVTAGKDRWVLSLSGASAVLLKMDEAQGRVGTPGALVKRGTQAESSVLAAVPAPVVHAVRALPERKGDAALAKPLLAAIDAKEVGERCNGDHPKPADVQVHRLTDRKVLLSIPCAMGAYNFGGLNWLANDRPPYQPQQLDAEGEFDAADGSIRSSMKGRGIGDCWSLVEWHFDGKGFVLTGESGDSMCRGFAGGAWQLPVRISKVVLPTNPVSKKP
ncbi:Protein of unknown function (DUF1176) [Acidovorax sp. CF316]|uniref:DUF1176 domain-containing protein n=1 Tax=Acidovorax sp. CF316 TaxID=1144317 RepID=UPI00026BC234|nr:DUF1176 domain-containing protein [Acidovorax sp. CF316]EJE54533.1 Protein of unknown function (DUF1176) [Acidovorax sp. CF316]